MHHPYPTYSHPPRLTLLRGWQAQLLSLLCARSLTSGVWAGWIQITKTIPSYSVGMGRGLVLDLQNKQMQFGMVLSPSWAPLSPRGRSGFKLEDSLESEIGRVNAQDTSVYWVKNLSKWLYKFSATCQVRVSRFLQRCNLVLHLSFFLCFPPKWARTDPNPIASSDQSGRTPTWTHAR